MDDKVILLVERHRQRSFWKREISLTIPVCVLLGLIFLLSVLIVSIVSFYWIDGTVCYVNNQEEVIQPRTIYHSRPKRSSALKKSNDPCLSVLCCQSPYDPNILPWTQNRLPTNVYPIDYQLTLSLYNLIEDNNNTYNGTVDIVLEVQSPTFYIVLHADLFISEIIVSQRSSPNDIPFGVDCAVPYQNTQTLAIHLMQELQVGEIYDLRISFYRSLNIHGIGLFENQFNKDQYGIDLSRIILTHFQPVHAREAFPCFDEPGFKAKFQLSVYHENNTQVLSNWDQSGSFLDEDRYLTEFETVPPIPTELIAFTIFYNDDFSSRSTRAIHPITGRVINVNLWARNVFFDNDNGIYVDAPLDMIQKILTALLNIFQDIQDTVVPNKIDILAVPEYPSVAVSHWGLIIFTELALLHNPMTTSELEHQRIALLIAKELAEQWCANFISIQWWTDLWLQEAIANYLKYHAVDGAYPDWTIHDQFSVGELLPTLFQDSMSVSHPIYKSLTTAMQIDEYFDIIETTKGTAILRMADYYVGQTMGIQNQTLSNIVSFLRDREYGYLIPDELLSKYQIGLWNGLDFFDRWLYQANFPVISAQFILNQPNNIFQLTQTRFQSADMSGYDLYPPETNPFNYIWYVPITCRFGNDSNQFLFTRTFLLDRSSMTYSFGSQFYTYYYCNTDFAGYYIMDYTDENWQGLAEAVDNDNAQLTDMDRANLLNNAFMGAQTVNLSYLVVREMTQFLYRTPYTGVLPWQTLSYHVNRMLDILDFESLFSVVQKYFQLVVRNYYRTYESTLWNDNDPFSEEILKGVIIQLACRLELQECIDKVTSLWDEAYPVLENGLTNHSVPDHAREVVYETHFQNTYNDSEWNTIESDYHTFVDVQERYHLLEALTQSRQPYHLYQLLYRDAQENKDRDMDLLEVLTLLARNPNGRELVWLYYRDNWAQLQLDYGRTNPRLGQLLIDVTATFEDQFHEYELLEYLVSTTGISTNVDARYWALERASMNLWWIINKSADISSSFDLDV